MILSNLEKEGSPIMNNQSIDEFRDWLNICDLHDICFVGPKFMWYNGRIKEHLEKAMGNSS